MCTGLEIAAVASLAASAGGSYMNSQQAAKNSQAKINARNEQAQLEQGRQKQFQDANNVAINNNLDNLSADKQQQSFGDLVANREQAYSDNAPAASEFANISDTTPNVVKTDLANKVADGLAKSKASAKALAKIGGTTDLFQNNGFDINNTANQIGTTNNLARGSLQTNLAEQTGAANNAGNGKSTFGDLLSAAGAAGSIYTGANGGLGAAFGGTGAAAAADPLKEVGPFTNATPWRNIPTVQTASAW